MAGQAVGSSEVVALSALGTCSAVGAVEAGQLAGQADVATEVVSQIALGAVGAAG